MLGYQMMILFSKVCGAVSSENKFFLLGRKLVETHNIKWAVKQYDVLKGHKY